MTSAKNRSDAKQLLSGGALICITSNPSVMRVYKIIHNMKNESENQINRATPNKQIIKNEQ
jgi:hypothetical protein